MFKLLIKKNKFKNNKTCKIKTSFNNIKHISKNNFNFLNLLSILDLSILKERFVFNV